jgi:hypothetical protein
MDILYLVDRLENLIASSRRMPLVNQVIVKEAELLNIIDQMRTTIPDEVKQARRIIQEKERILAQAQADATTIQARARQETERALQREGLLRAAEERSQDMMRMATEQAQLIVRRAEEHTEQLKIDADGYVTETLRNLREHLVNVETDMGRTILSIEKGLESLQGRPSIPNEYDEDSYEEEEEVVEIEAPEESFVEPEPVPPPARRSVAPRRSSLAADTMGAGPYS